MSYFYFFDLFYNIKKCFLVQANFSTTDLQSKDFKAQELNVSNNSITRETSGWEDTIPSRTLGAYVGH